MNKAVLKPLWEMTKDLLRLVVFALPGVAIAYFSDLPSTQTTVIVLIVLRGIDSYIHNDPGNNAKGLVPF